MTSASPDSKPSRRAIRGLQLEDAVLEAARVIVIERDVSRFTADVLALRSGVARRTIFNRFGSLDGVIEAVCLREMSAANAEVRRWVEFAPLGDGGPECIFQEVAAAMRLVDSASAILFIRDAYRFQSSRLHADRSASAAFRGAAAGLEYVVAARYPDVDVLDISLLLGALIQGYATVASVWLTEAGAGGNPPSPERWAELLDRLLAGAWLGFQGSGGDA